MGEDRNRQYTNQPRQRDKRARKLRRRNQMITMGIICFVAGSMLGAMMSGLITNGKSKQEAVDTKKALSEATTEIAELKNKLEEQQTSSNVAAEDEANNSSHIKEETWELRLVNQYNILSEDEVIETAEIENGFLVDIRIIDPLKEMLDACKAEGIDIYVRSAFREWATQEKYFNNKMQIARDANMSYYDAFMDTTEYTAIPGASEHQIGLAVDLISTEYEKLDSKQANTKVAKWLLEHASEYGFILRFPEGKEEITGVQYEPWHYRYVGVEVAKEIMEKGITLEEYLGEN